MKILITVVLIVFITIYMSFFMFSFETYRDYGTLKKKHIKWFFMFKLTETYIDDYISDYILSRKLNTSEKWVKISNGRGGVFKDIFYENQYDQKISSKINLFNEWLIMNKKLDRVSDVEIDIFIKPLVIKFLECYRKDDFAGLSEVNMAVLNDIYKKK